MAGYAPKTFKGLPGEDPTTWLLSFRQWCEAAGHNPAANAAMRNRLLGIFETCLEDEARDWYESKIRGKNWKLRYLTGHVGAADLAAIRALNNGAVAGLGANTHIANSPAADLIVRAGGDVTITGANLAPAATGWNEDWSFSGGVPTDDAVNAPNTNNANPVVAPGIRLGQVLYTFTREYPTVAAERTKMAFQNIIQGNDHINKYYVKLKRMVPLAYPSLSTTNQAQILKQKFLEGLSYDNQMEARRIGLDNTVEHLKNKIEEIENFRTKISPSIQQSIQQPIQPSITTADIDRIISSRLQEIKQPIIQPSSQPVIVQPSRQPVVVQQYYDPRDKGAFDRMLQLSYRLGFPDPDDESKVTMQELEAFIDESLQSRLPNTDGYNSYLLRRSFGIGAVPRKIYYDRSTTNERRRCSNCHKAGHTKKSCSAKKVKSKGRGRKKTNYAQDNYSSSDTNSSSDSDSDSDSDDHLCLGMHSKKKDTKKKPYKKTQTDRNHIINDVFRLLVKVIVEEFIKVSPKEHVVVVYNHINTICSMSKDVILNSLKGEPSVKTREKIWNSVGEIVNDVILPMRNVVSAMQTSNLILKHQDPLFVNESSWTFSPADISVVNRKSASDIVTIKSKIIAPDTNKSLVCPVTILDTGSDSSLISDKLVKRLDLEVDKTNAPDLRGVSTKTDTIGTVYGLGISIYDSDNSFTVIDDFMVIRSDKDFLLLGVPWIDRAKAIVDFSNRQLCIPISQRKKIIIPLSLHKRKSNVVSLNIDTIDLKKVI
jgi:hypothetical protein